MKWTSALAIPEAGKSNLPDAIANAAGKVLEDLAGPPDLVIGFFSPDFSAGYDHIPHLVRSKLTCQAFVGCSAGGIIGGGQEIEHRSAISLTGALLPDVQIHPFHLSSDDLPDLDDPPEKWERIVGVEASSEPSFILLPDPFSFRIDAMVQGLDFAFPGSIKIGGLASGAHAPRQNALFLNDSVYREGVVGLVLTGNVVVETVVAQGCRPIGRPMRVSKCDRNLLFELDGQPAVFALHDVLADLSRRDQELARHSLFLGVVMDEFKDEFKPGDFLIRNILGVEPNTGALVVGELLRNERTVQFHLRDAATSADDLRFLLKDYRDSHQQKAAGALLFSCLGRGQYLYGEANHDSDCFREYLGEIPLGGFFCNGEIGPVGGTTFLHGYTSSFGIFRERQALRA